MDNVSGAHRPWDALALRKSFHAIALNAESYWDQTYPKAASQPGYEYMVDEAIAKFYVFDALGSRAWNTPDELIKVVRELLVWDIRESQMLDSTRVKRHQHHHLNALIAEYGD